MSILRLRNYTADVEVLGTVCRVEYNGDANVLSIHGVEIGFAGRILEKLATGTVRAVQQDRRIPPVAEETPTDPASDLDGPAGDERVSITPEGKAALAAERVVEPEAENPKLHPEVEQLPEKTARDGSIAVDTPEPGTPAAAFAEEEAESRVPSELLNARRLRDVLVFFMDRGVVGADAVAAECAKYRDAVPLLKRVSNLSERVRRTYEIIESEGEPADVAKTSS